MVLVCSCFKFLLLFLPLLHIRYIPQMCDSFWLPITWPTTLRLEAWRRRAKLGRYRVKRIPLTLSSLKSREFAFLQCTLHIRTAAPNRASHCFFMYWLKLCLRYFHWGGGGSCPSLSSLVKHKTAASLYAPYAKDACSISFPMAHYFYMEK